MATTKKAATRTLFFETKEQCTRACESLGLSLRKVTDIDKSHGGNYSKFTGHYGRVFRRGNMMRVSIRSKLIVDEEIMEGLSETQVRDLGAIDSTRQSHWIAQ